MKITWKSGLLFFLIAIVTSALGCALALGLWHQPHENHLHAKAHEVMQRELGLSGAQIRQLEALEDPYLEREAKLKHAHAVAVGKLADALVQDRSFSPNVESAVTEVHQSQAELQKATIEHLLEMEPALTAEQFGQLLERVGQALRGQAAHSEPHSH